MAKLAIIFIAMCLLVQVKILRFFIQLKRAFANWVMSWLLQQVALAETRQKRDDETTTHNILDSLKTGIEETFSEKNIKKTADTLNEAGAKIMDLGTKIFTNFQNAFKPEDTTGKPAP